MQAHKQVQLRMLFIIIDNMVYSPFKPRYTPTEERLFNVLFLQALSEELIFSVNADTYWAFSLFLQVAAGQ